MSLEELEGGSGWREEQDGGHKAVIKYNTRYGM